MVYYKPMENNAQRCRKPFREWLLNLCGYEIWPPTHNDPRIQGPQPRILTRRQWAALVKNHSGNSCDCESSAERNDDEFVR